MIEDSSRFRRSARREPREQRGPEGGESELGSQPSQGVWQRAGGTWHPGQARGLACPFPLQPVLLTSRCAKSTGCRSGGTAFTDDRIQRVQTVSDLFDSQNVGV